MSNSLDMSGYDVLGWLVVTMMILCLTFVPLGIWKAVELLIAVCQYIHWS